MRTIVRMKVQALSKFRWQCGLGLSINYRPSFMIQYSHSVQKTSTVKKWQLSQHRPNFEHFCFGIKDLTCAQYEQQKTVLNSLTFLRTYLMTMLKKTRCWIQKVKKQSV